MTIKTPLQLPTDGMSQYIQGSSQVPDVAHCATSRNLRDQRLSLGTIGEQTLLDNLFSKICSISALSYSFEFVVVGGVPSDYFVSTQLQLWLFCCWGCGCCWAVKISCFWIEVVVVI